MTRNAKIGVGVAVFLLVAWAIGNDGSQDAPAAPAPVEVPAPAPAPEPEPEPEPAPEPEPELEITDEDVIEAVGADYFLDMVWAEMDLDAQVELCLGVGIFGAEGAAEIVVAEAPSFAVKDVAEWLERTCS